MFRVIIAGSRTFNDYILLKQKLDYLLKDKVAAGETIVIVSGTAQGADKLGERYAKEKGYQIDRHPADWDRHGKSAGYIRNAEMAEVADACVCFMYKSGSRGTQHMINIAKEKGLILRVILFE